MGLLMRAPTFLPLSSIPPAHNAIAHHNHSMWGVHMQSCVCNIHVSEVGVKREEVEG